MFESEKLSVPLVMIYKSLEPNDAWELHIHAVRVCRPAGGRLNHGVTLGMKDYMQTLSFLEKERREEEGRGGGETRHRGASFATEG